MSILAQIIGLACLLFWGFWLCCKLRLPAGLELAIGDVLSFGASHPCLTFDKWQRLLLVAVVMIMDTLSAWLRRRYIGGAAVPLYQGGR